MMFAFAALLFIAWVFGMVTANMLGGYLHLLLLFAIALVLTKLIYAERLR
jgi:hypothetical protein